MCIRDRARKYADAALGKVEKEALKAEIAEKRNKDLLMSIGLLPLAPESTDEEDRKRREEDLLDRYQFIQKFRKESRNYGAQRDVYKRQIEDTGATSVIGPGDVVTVDERLNLIVKVADNAACQAAVEAGR